MANPQIIHGSASELLPYLEEFQDRASLTLIIPDEDQANLSAPTSAEIEEANARLRRHIVTLSPCLDLDNTHIDADLGHA